MASILKVDTIQDQSGNNIINESANTITIGASGDTITIPSGATITNSGTATGFGKVLQFVNASFSGDSSSTTSTSFVDTANILNITPLLSNSKIIVFSEGAVSIAVGSENQRIDLRLIETVTSTTISDKRYIGQDSTGHSKFNIPVNLSGTFTNSSTDQKTFKMQLRKAEANANESGIINPNWYTGATHTISAMEIEI